MYFIIFSPYCRAWTSGHGLKKLQISLKKFLENLNSAYRPMHTNIEIFRKEEPICSII